MTAYFFSLQIGINICLQCFSGKIHVIFKEKNIRYILFYLFYLNSIVGQPSNQELKKKTKKMWGTLKQTS